MISLQTRLDFAGRSHRPIRRLRTQTRAEDYDSVDRSSTAPAGVRLAPTEASHCVHAGGAAGLTRLRKRVFELSLEHCASCGCEVKTLAAILAQPVIEKSLTHLDLKHRRASWGRTCCFDSFAASHQCIECPGWVGCVSMSR